MQPRIQACPSEWQCFLSLYQLHHTAWCHQQRAESTFHPTVYVTDKDVNEHPWGTSLSTKEKKKKEKPKYPKVEGTQKDRVQILALHRITQNPNPMSESIVQTLPELQQLGATTTALGSLFQPVPSHPLVKTLSLAPSLTLPDAAPCCSLGSCHCQQREEISACPSVPPMRKL